MVTKTEVVRQLGMELEMRELLMDVTLAMLLVFPTWVSTHFDFQEQEEP